MNDDPVALIMASCLVTLLATVVLMLLGVYIAQYISEWQRSKSASTEYFHELKAEAEVTDLASAGREAVIGRVIRARE